MSLAHRLARLERLAGSDSEERPLPFVVVDGRIPAEDRWIINEVAGERVAASWPPPFVVGVRLKDVEAWKTARGEAP
jgi:hypothetical protein